MLREREAGKGLEFRAGKRSLSRHRPDLAVAFFRAAAEACPASSPGLLAERLYWLALALLRLDRAELALKSLASAQKLRPRGYARRAYERRGNEYGMIRRQAPELDDFYAFYSIQACRYLNGRPGRRFASMGEKDAVLRLIAESWTRLRATGRLEGAGTSAKLELFKAWPVALPDFADGGRGGYRGADGAEGGRCREPLEVDFRKGRVIGAEDRCSCGSGLPYCRCCGRTQSLREL